MSERFDHETEPLAPRVLHASEGPRAQVLIIDDDGDGRLVCENYCDLFDHDALSVGTGAEAVAALGRVSFDVVVLNLHMRSAGGLEAVRAIRALPDPAGRAPIVGMTAVGRGDEAQRWLAAGLAAVVAKPVTAARFFAALGAAMLPDGPQARSWAPAR
jgi:CheY-like chemotaxis protein